VGGEKKEREDKRGGESGRYLELGRQEDLSTLWWPRARTAER